MLEIVYGMGAEIAHMGGKWVIIRELSLILRVWFCS